MAATYINRVFDSPLSYRPVSNFQQTSRTTKLDLFGSLATI